MADDAPVSITIPVKIGLSLKDYYGGDTFGYFSAGVQPRPFDQRHGRGSRRLTVYGFGDTLKFVNNDKAGQAVGSVGFSVGF